MTPPSVDEQSKALADAIEQQCQLKDWPALTGSVEKLLAFIRTASEPFPLKPAKNILGSLRKRRRFVQMQQVGDALRDSGQSAPVVQRQIAQAYIEQGLFAEADSALGELAEATAGEPGSTEWIETRGLRGRLRKQEYVEARRANRRGRAVDGMLQRAITSYAEAWNHEPASPARAKYERDNHWPGINLVACAARAERDKLKLAQPIDWRALAERILASIESDWSEAHGDATWSAASALEACIALSKPQADIWLHRYVASRYADAFELASTTRQLQEVWQIEASDPGPGRLLAVLLGRRATLVEGDLEIGVRELQAIHGYESYVRAEWVDQLQRTFGAVLRIEHGGRGVGTGFVVDGGELHPDLKGHHVALTNQHVVSEPQYEPSSLTPSQARLRFPIDNSVRRVKQQLWPTEAGEELDVAILQIEDGKPIERSIYIMRLQDLDQGSTPPPRLYVIGYPGGGSLYVSLYDNRFVRVDDTALLYRSPTDRGHSGSPVMNVNFDAVAVHRASRTKEPANEGVLIEAVRRRLMQSPPRKPI